MSNTPANPVVFASENKGSKPAFFQRIRPPFSKLNFKKTGIAGLVVLLVFALVLGVYLSRKPTQLKPKATGEEVSLSIRPADTNTALNQEFNLDVFFDAGATNFEITTIQAKINYDPQLLELKNVVIKDFLPVFQPPANTSGSTIFSVASVTPKQGSGVVATLTFKALTASGGPAQVTFDQSQTEVYEISHDDALATALTPGTVTFGAQSSGSPSPTPSSSPKTSLSLESLAIPGPVPPGAQFQVKVLTRSDIENANLWNATINFPKDLVEAVSIDKTGSVISSWSAESLDNSTGQIQLVGGVPAPGYKTTSSNALIATLTFKTKSIGTASLAFDPLSAIYSNANNTNILQEKSGISVSIANEVTASPSPSPSTSPSSSPSPSASPSPSPSPSGTSGKGDGDDDGQVDFRDLSVLFSKWSPAADITSHFKLDFNNDLRINSLDFSAMNQLLLSLGVIKQ